MVLFLKSWDELAERLLDAFLKTDDSPKIMKQTEMKPVPANDPFVCAPALSLVNGLRMRHILAPSGCILIKVH